MRDREGETERKRGRRDRGEKTRKKREKTEDCVLEKHREESKHEK
jgi:hypothetical protein